MFALGFIAIINDSVIGISMYRSGKDHGKIEVKKEIP
jgi:hypothetical protein